MPASSLADAAPPELKQLATQLAARWPLPLAGLHRCEFEEGDVVLTLAYGDARALAPELRLGADALFLDGFAPDRNPEMWEPALLRALARLARPDCHVATWSTARAVRDALADAGFELELAPGFGRKRQMLRGRYAPRFTLRRHEPPAARADERTAVVIGAGLAGAACAHALARRGWVVRVIDSAGPAGAASSLPWGLMHPQFAVDDNRLARLSRAGCALTAAALERVAPAAVHRGEAVWSHDGFFQQVTDAREAERWQRALDAQRLPSDYVEWLDRSRATARLGVAPGAAGLWWREGWLIAPPRLVSALLDAPSIAVLQATVGEVAQRDGGWQVFATDGEHVASASALIVAAALDTPRMLGASMLPVQAIPGQVTFIRAPELLGLRAGLGGDGTLLRAPDGRLAVGATYETPLGGVPVWLDERMAARSNLARLERLLADPVDARVDGRYSGVRCVARDRLPYIGGLADEAAAQDAKAALRGAHLDDLPRRAGLYVSFAHGSRGLTFAALAGELIAAQLEGEPLPVERALAEAVDPGRVLLRRLRRGAVGLHAAAPPR